MGATLSVGLIAGIGGAVFIAIVIATIWLHCHHKSVHRVCAGMRKIGVDQRISFISYEV